MRISLFATCLTDTLFPQTAISVVRILQRLGHEVSFDERQTCCGQMHVNAGYARDALPLVRRTIEVLEAAEAVVCPSASCTAMIREHYVRLAREAGDEALLAAATALAQRTYELSELLIDVLHTEDVGASFPHRITYHASCHGLRVLDLGDRPLRLLSAVRGAQLLPLDGAEECCGFGGTFAVKNADTSAAMAADKLDRIRRSGAEVCVATDNSCLMQIDGALRRRRAGVRTMHLAEVLAARE